jgi:hypothetical protein
MQLTHRAELLRRAQVARRQASRTVAGPAPPPSWQSSSAAPKIDTPRTEAVRSQVTIDDLRRSASLFSLPLVTGQARLGPHRLVEQSFRAILRDLNRAVSIEDEIGPIILADLLREQLGYLSNHLQSGLLEVSSLLPQNDPKRLSDQSLKALLCRPESRIESEEDWDDGSEASEGEDDWVDSAPDTIHHLPLTLHPSPAAFLRNLPILTGITLTSLNLAYSTLADLDRFANVLPTGLRELGLCGVTLRRSENRLADGDAWRRCFAALGRKLIVLTVGSGLVNTMRWTIIL